MADPETGRPRIGLILHRGRDPLYHSFIDAMATCGFVDGTSVDFEPRFAEGVLERTTGFAEDLVRRGVDVIAAIGAVGAEAARKATSTIPIVYAIVLDPVETGFAASLERPGGNMTGVTNFDPDLALAQLSLLREALPGLRRFAILSDPDIPRPGGSNSLERSCESAAGQIGMDLVWFRPGGSDLDLAGAFADMTRSGCSAMLVLEVPKNIGRFETIAHLANEWRLASVFPDGWNHAGLLSYGTSLLRSVHEVPGIIRRILDGTHPGDIPVMQVRQHRLKVNLSTARHLELGLPQTLIARADHVIG